MALRGLLLLPLMLATAPQAWSADANDLVRVLQSGRCANCRLADADLVHADLRNSDLSGAQLSPGALEQSHWQGARGIEAGTRSHAALHNAGVDSAQAGRWQEAETLFSAAIGRKPEEPLSWVARGLSRGEQGKTQLAARDLAHAGRLFEEQGDSVKAQQLQLASQLKALMPMIP